MKKTDLKIISTADKTKGVRGPYKKTRLNAVRHGLSSNCEVLPWEDPRDLLVLKQRLIEEHKPNGLLEAQVIDDIAMIIFRKQRLYRAENALIVEHLGQTGSHHDLNKQADLLSAESDLEKAKTAPFKEILHPNEERDKEDLVDCQEIIEECQPILDAPEISYEEALQAMPQDFLQSWKTGLRNQFTDKRFNRYTQTIDSLKTFLRERVIETVVADINIIKAKKQIREQAINLSYAPSQKMEILRRYEAELDRSLSKKIDLLLKLQEKRRNQGTIIDAS